MDEKIIEEIKNVMDLHVIEDRGDYIDGIIDGLQMAIDIIKRAENKG